MKRIAIATAVTAAVLTTGPPADAGTPPPVISETFTQTPGGMTPVAGGAFTTTGGAYALGAPAPAERGNGNFATHTTPLTGDFTLTVSGKSTAGKVSVLYDYSDPQNYSYAQFSTVAHDFTQGVFKVRSGAVTQLATFDNALSTTAGQSLKVKYGDGKIKVYKDTVYLTGFDASVRSGARIGLGAQNTPATFDDLSVIGTAAPAPIAPLPQVVPAPPTTPPDPPTSCAAFAPVRTVPITTAAELTAALADAAPGDDLRLAPGTYTGAFTAATAATSARPIRLTGQGATLDGGGIADGYVLHLTGATHWCVDSLTLTNGRKAVMADQSSDNVLQNLEIGQIGDEGVHFRSCSSNNILSDSRIHDTGLRRDSFGEGVYLGTSDGNWSVYNTCDPGNPDRSDYNRILGNTFDHTAAESIDAKEGTTGGLISGNHFDAVGMTGNHADSLVDIKGTAYTVADNTGTVTGPSSLIDGFQTHVVTVQSTQTHSGTANTFTHNTLALPNTPGQGINIATSGTALITCDNLITGPALGPSNQPCRP